MDRLAACPTFSLSYTRPVLQSAPVKPLCLSYLLFLVLSLCSGFAAAKPTSVSASATVFLKVRVTDNHNNAVTGLSREQFQISEKGKPLEITSFETMKGAASVGILLDWSGSMTGSPREMTLETAEKFLHRFPQGSDYLIVLFNTRQVVICEHCNEVEASQALTNIKPVEPHRNTSFYDSVELALTKLKQSRNLNRILLAFTDGQDNESKLSFSKLRDQLRESNITLFAITSATISGYKFPGATSTLVEEGFGILKELCNFSGGRNYYLREKKDAAELADVLAAQTNQYYLIGFRPLDAAPDQKWHQIKIKLEFPRVAKPPRYDLTYRPGYYSR